MGKSPFGGWARKNPKNALIMIVFTGAAALVFFLGLLFP